MEGIGSALIQIAVVVLIVLLALRLIVDPMPLRMPRRPPVPRDLTRDIHRRGRLSALLQQHDGGSDVISTADNNQARDRPSFRGRQRPSRLPLRQSVCWQPLEGSSHGSCPAFRRPPLNGDSAHRGLRIGCSIDGRVANARRHFRFPDGVAHRSVYVGVPSSQSHTPPRSTSNRLAGLDSVRSAPGPL